MGALIGLTASCGSAAIRWSSIFIRRTVADEDGSVANAYGVSSTLGLTARVTFLIGGDGRVQRVWPDVDPAVNADEVLAAIKMLRR